jgi:integrase
MRASELLPKHITRLQSTLSDTLSPKSVNNITDKIRSIMRYGAANMYVPTSTYKLDGYKKLQVDNISEFVLSPDEIRELIKSIDKPRTKLFIAMAYFTAQRPASLLRLQVKDVEDGFISFSAIKKQKSHKVAIRPELKV